jgi:fatty-acyl-CoA synthase
MLTVTDMDTQLHSVPLFHVNGWGSPHGITGSGATHVIVRDFRAPEVLEAIQKEKVTIGAMVPAMVNTLLHFPDADKYDTSSLERMIIGGAPMPITIARAAQEKFGVVCYQAYGMTETCPMLTLATLKDNLKKLPFEEQLAYRSKTGKPVFGVELRVVDENGKDIEPNGVDVGEIIVRGNNVMKGFWKDPEATAKVIVDGWMHTGDIANIDKEGYVQIVDRGKDMIISGGENVASAEVEMAIYKFPAVMECAVSVFPIPSGAKRLRHWLC